MLFSPRCEAFISSHAGIAQQDTLQIKVVVVEYVRIVVFFNDSLGNVCYEDGSVSVPSKVQLVLFVGWETSKEQSQGVHSICGDVSVGNYLVFRAI